MKGHIYALINPSLNGLVKVGKTTRNPEERARELSASTGVPTPFIVGYSALVSNCDKAEQHLHELLSLQGYRLSENREFFQVSLNQIVRLFLDCEQLFGCSGNVDELDRNDHIENAESVIADLLGEADDLLTGENGSFIDQDAAVEKLQLAAKLGSADAYYKLGCLFSDTESELNNAKKAILMFNMALKAGYSPLECYGQLGSTYANNGDKRNAGIAYSKLFNDCGLMNTIQLWRNYQDAQKFISDDSEGGAFFAAARDELVKSEFSLIEDEEELNCKMALATAGMLLTAYFSQVNYGLVKPIFSEAIIEILPLSKAYALTYLPERAVFYEIWEGGVQRYLEAFDLDEALLNKTWN